MSNKLIPYHTIPYHTKALETLLLSHVTSTFTDRSSYSGTLKDNVIQNLNMIVAALNRVSI